MKTKRNILTALLAGTLIMASSLASAVPVQVWSWNGTVAQWANPVAPPNGGGGGNGGLIYDGFTYNNGATPASAPNGGNAGTGAPTSVPLQDTTFTFVSNTMGATNVAMSETHDVGRDLYNVNINAAGANLTVGGVFSYMMTTVDPVGFTMASLDSIVIASNGVVRSQIYTDQTMTTLLWDQLSTNGQRTPLAGWIAFNPAAVYTNIYIVNTIVSGAVTNVFNEIIPEPETLALFGIGLLGLFGMRRKSNASSMSMC